MPRSRSARRASRPRNVGLSHATTQRQAGLRRCDARTELVSVQGQSGLEPERVASTEPAGATAAPRIARHKSAAASAGTAHSTPSSPV